MRRAKVFVLSLLHGGLIVNSHSASQSERALVDLVVLLADNALHEGEAMLYVAIKWRLFAVSCLVHFTQLSQGGFLFSHIPSPALNGAWGNHRDVSLRISMGLQLRGVLVVLLRGTSWYENL